MDILPGEAHAALRLKARYGVRLTPELKKEIVREIKRANNLHKLHGAQRKRERKHKTLPRPPRAHRLNSRKVRNQKWKVDTSAGLLVLIFDSVDKVLVTFLPASEGGS